MTRILMVETATPKRVRKKAELILAGGVYDAPEVVILCRDDAKTYRYLAEIPSVQVIQLRKESRSKILGDLNRRDFDVLIVFWTGESRYRSMKLLALRLRARATDVDIGDGSVFRLTWKAYVRHWQFRLAHPLPTDHWVLVPPPDSASGEGEPDYREGEKVLVVQSAEPTHVLRALERMKVKPLFHNPRYTLFCRNRPDIVRHFQNHPMIHEILTHSETRGSWEHLKSLRKERFDAVVAFFTGDPSYWKVKYLPFLLGIRSKVIFNESNDCFYFSLGEWLALLSHRLGERSGPEGRPRWARQSSVILLGLIKMTLLPFRFIWLLIVWVRLRSTAWIESS